MNSGKKLFKGRRRRLVGILVLCVGVTALVMAAQASSKVKIVAGNIEVEIEGGVTPKALPKNELAPITLKVEGAIKTKDGTHVPALQTIDLEFDKNGTIFTKGLPTCSVSKLQSTLTSQAEAACKSSLIGTGKVSVEVQFPEQAPFSATGKLLIFNGVPQGNKPVLIFHTYVKVPAPTTVVTTGVVGKASGKYGTSTVIKIPSIASGQGSLTSFEATISKKWTYKGKKESLLLAKCPTGSLQAHGEFSFADGTKIAGSVVKPCTGK
jgi:hypothetical protein